jgi:hypothetical protein
MEKYGFIYIWFDRKHKRYYIGSHWGTETDRYVCSSKWMNKAYARRTNDFKRRILKRVYSSRKDMLEEETRWLQMIKPEEIKIRYYNLKRSGNHWSASEYDRLRINQKIAIKTKEAMSRPDVRKNYENGLKERDTSWTQDPKVLAQKSRSMMGKNKRPGNWKAAIEKNRGRPLTEEHKAKITNAGVFASINKKKIQCMHCEFTGNAGNIGRYHNDKCKKKIV